MKRNIRRGFACHAIVMLALLYLTSNGKLNAAEAQREESHPRLFASPNEAIKTLVSAATARDKAALRAIFGPELQDLLTGDEVQDQAHFNIFTRAVNERCNPVSEGQNKQVLEIGSDRWPFPIPLAKKDGQWFFDTDAGKEEIVSRHIGSDELHAIGVCRAYVEAQREYASRDPEGTGLKKYALKLKSDPGAKNGLSWESAPGEPAAPLQALVEEARAEGYGKNSNQSNPKQFHGYHFKILTAQGPSAPGGKMDYMVNGSLSRGFALVAYPANWGKSGVMTFIVNQDGKVYQRNLGEKTSELASAMTEYNPSGKWTMVREKGIIDGPKELARNSE